MKERWQIETERYVPRISAALKIVEPVLALTQQQLPRPPFSNPVTAEQHFSYSLAIFEVNGVTVVDQLFDNVGLLWSQGRMVGITGMARFALEYWAAMNFGRSIVEQFSNDHDLEKAVRKTARLTFSAKTPVALPWGGYTTNAAYNILTLVEKLSKSHPEVLEDYNFLSEGSHPSFLQNTYFIMASKTYDNYHNDSFRVHAHEILERTIAVIERVAAGVANDAQAVLRLCAPLLAGLK